LDGAARERTFAPQVMAHSQSATLREAANVAPLPHHAGAGGRIAFGEFLRPPDERQPNGATKRGGNNN
jgi:hypothetical protein